MKCPVCQKELSQRCDYKVEMTGIYEECEPIPIRILVELETPFECTECCVRVFATESFNYVLERKE